LASGEIHRLETTVSWKNHKDHPAHLHLLTEEKPESLKEGSDGFKVEWSLRYRERSSSHGLVLSPPLPFAFLPTLEERVGWMFKECKLMLLFEY
jgi:hypothetical protein